MKDFGLYLVTDQFDLSEDEFLNVIEQSIQGGVSIVQIREKTSTTKDFYELAKKCKDITDKYNVPLIINDRIDVAQAVDAAGVHLGQDDMPCTVARRILGADKTIGISASNYEEAKKAQDDGADYLGVGAIVETSTKKDAKIVTHEDLEKIKEEIEIPTVAIGGVNESNTNKIVTTYDFDGIAVVSAIMLADDPKKASENLLDLIDS